MPPVRRLGDRRRNEPEKPLRAELLSIEGLEERARALAASFTLARDPRRHTDGRLDRYQLVRFMTAYQTVAPLTIGELWAWPSMVKLALIENLRRLTDETLQGRDARLRADGYLAQIGGAGDAAPLPSLPEVLETAYVVRLVQRMREYGPLVSPVRAAAEERLAAQGMTAEDSIRKEHQRQAAGQVSVANAITSLRLCATLDWMQYFENVSLIEQVLQRDPAGVYGSMDFLSRDRYRQAVEELAEATREAQLRVAPRTVEGARAAAPPPPPRQRVPHPPRPAPARPPRPATAPPPPRLPGRRARGRAYDGRRPHAAHERGRGGRASGARGGPGPGKRRPAHTLRYPRRLHGRAYGRDADRRRDPGRRPLRRRRLERPPRSGTHRPVPPLPSCASVERRRGLVDGLGAQAREARGVQPPAAGG